MKYGKRIKYTARICVLICVIFAVGAVAQVFAADGGQKPVRVGYYENEVFQEGAGEDSVKTGYSYEYYQKLSEYTGWKYEYVYGEFGDLYQMLLDGKIDFLAGLAWKEEREALIGYPDSPMGHENYSLIKHLDDEDITLDTATLGGKKIGVLDSATADRLREFLDEKNITAQVEVFRDYGPLFEAFDSRGIDILAAEGDGAYGRPDAELLCSFGASDYYLCVSKTRPDLLKELNAAQSELSENEPNFINSLRNKYYPVSISGRAFSAVEKKWLSEHDTLSVGYLKNYLPYCDQDASGNVTGLIRDLVPGMLERLKIDGLKVGYKSFDNYLDMISSLVSGEIDVAFPVGGGLYYSEESGIFQSGAVVSAVTELVYKGEFSEATVLNFAVNENNRMQYYFVKTHYPDAVISFYPSVDACLKAVDSGKASCTTLNGLRVNDILRNSRYKDLVILQTSYDDDRCFGVRLGNEGLLKLVNRAISVLGPDYAQTLAFRYTYKLYSYSFADMFRDNAFFFVSVIVGVAVVIILLLVRDRRRSKREIETKDAAKKELERANKELIEQKESREQLEKMITALASDYRCVYHVDLDKNDAVCYRADPTDTEQTREGIHFNYLERFTWYAEHSVAESYREGFLQFIDPVHVREALSKDVIIAYRYLAQRGGKEYYEMIRMAGVRHAENRDDHIVHAVGLGLTVIDAEMRDAMAKNQALGEALTAAEGANRAKTAFLSSMSHEIRTPMNAIIGLDSLALRDESLPEKTRGYLKQIGGSAKHLLGLINDILDMSRIESGKLVLRREEFSLSEMLEQINTMVTSQCGEKGLKFECKVLGEPDDHYIGDDMRLKQVLVNILSNAVKFTDAPGSVTFVVEKINDFEDQSTLRFSVKDTGIGISKEFLPKVFDSFSQENSGRSGKYGSTGLGLAITRNIVELMNGTISVESTKGVGTEFTVDVTLKNCHDPSFSPDAVAAGDLHALVVDADPVSGEHAKLVMEESGIRTESCPSGKGALEMLEVSHARHDPFNLVLLDRKLAGSDEENIAGEIKTRYGKETAVIILTAYNRDEITDGAPGAAADGFLSKSAFASDAVDEILRTVRRSGMSARRRICREELSGKRVLLAEDFIVNAEIVREVMGLCGVIVDHAENGKIAVETFEKSAPGYYDAILMDVRMPEMDGLEATRTIRKLPRPDAKTVPIIAMTANAFDEDVQSSLQAGMNAHLSKPVEAEFLYRTLEELIWENENRTKQ
ncbi:MAG: response regulator [Clostridia bacterium]|nr:response regulator [Clostridia bacterium]